MCETTQRPIPQSPQHPSDQRRKHRDLYDGPGVVEHATLYPLGKVERRGDSEPEAHPGVAGPGGRGADAEHAFFEEDPERLESEEEEGQCIVLASRSGVRVQCVVLWADAVGVR
jgi:hypothetical protein